MNNLKKNTSILLLVIFCISPLFLSAQARRKANKDTQAWRYEIEGVSQGSQGTYLIKVWSYSKKPKVAIEQSKKNAVHGIIFRGYEGNKKGIQTQRPMTRNSNLEQEKEAFFKDFFATGGKYMKFVSLTNDGAVAAGDRIKVGKEYKIGLIVSVRKDALRRDLEQAGIIKGLNSGF